MRLNTLILTLACLTIQNNKDVQGLNCVVCTNIELDDSIAGFVVNPVLRLIPVVLNTRCNEASIQSRINTVTCPPDPDSGHYVYRCGAYTGNINIANAISNSSLRTINRQCVLMYEGLKDGCHPLSYVEDDASDFQKILQSLENLGAVGFEGDICLSDTTKAEQQVATCSRGHTTQYPSLVSSLCLMYVFLTWCN
ncbi:uncharacterized protein [Argopecten irradians]|uniref:uncharacterized protein n=1 Tax=Argopecten irradians TaxID=31199 RepID=UPI0037154BD9